MSYNPVSATPDQTAGDIQALATAAVAGSIGKSADAGHQHPTTGLVTTANASTVTALITASGGINGLPTPLTPDAAAPKGYVDGVALGYANKHTAVAVATTNVALTGLPTMDGITLTDGQTAFLTAQTTASQNGLWAVHAGAWTRPTFFASGGDATGSYVFIDGGLTWGGAAWALNGESPQTIDTTSLTFVQFDRVTDVTASNGITKTGNNLTPTYGTAASTVAQGNDARIIGAEQTANKGVANGYASLDGTTKVPFAQLSLRPVSTKSANYAAATTDSVLLGNAAAAAITITLPAPTSGLVLSVKKTDSSVNAVTVATVSGNIDGAATKAINTQYVALDFVGDGTNWWIF